MTEIAPLQTGASVAGFDAGAHGVTPPSKPGRRGVFVSDVIIELGLADEKAVHEAEEAARTTEQTVEQQLLESGVIDEHKLSLAIAERNSLDHVDLERFEIDMGAAEMVGRSAAERYRAVPIAFASDGALLVAIEDPLDSLGISDIEVMTKSEVRPSVATPTDIRALIERLPPDLPRKAPSPEVPPMSQPSPTPEAPPPSNAQPMSPGPPPMADDPPDLQPPPISQGPPSPGAPPSLAASAPKHPEPTEEPQDDPQTHYPEEEPRNESPAPVLPPQRAERLEGDLAAARERVAELEQKLAGIDTMAGQLRETTEKLEALYRTLEDSIS